MNQIKRLFNELSLKPFLDWKFYIVLFLGSLVRRLLLKPLGLPTRLTIDPFSFVFSFVFFLVELYVYYSMFVWKD